MANNNALKKPAQTGLEELEMEIAGEGGNNLNTPAKLSTGSYETANIGPTTSAAEVAAGDELEEAGGNGPSVTTFYVHKIKPGKTLRDNQKIIAEGQQFAGTYEGSFTSGKFNSRTHKIKLADGQVIGTPSTGTLDAKFRYVPRGTRTVVTYQGPDVISSGQWEGSDTYSYSVALPKSLNALIAAGGLPENYPPKVNSK